MAQSLGGRGLAIAADCADEGQLRRAVVRAERELGAIQVVVVNAGISIEGAEDVTNGEWSKVHR